MSRLFVAIIFVAVPWLACSQPATAPADGTAQSFQAAMKIVCNAPTGCAACQGKTGNARNGALKAYLGQQIKNMEVRGLLARLDERNLNAPGGLAETALKKSGLTQCAFFDEQRALVAQAKANPSTKSDVSKAPTVKSPEKAATTHAAVAIADAILVAIADQSVEGIQAHFNKTNLRKVKPKRIPGMLKEARRTTDGVRAISELRAAPKFLGPGAVLGKVRVAGQEVFVIVLTQEDGTYKFEDINSPSVSRYERQPLLWSR